MKKGTGKNLSTSKQYNRGLILQLIATNEATSRIELATTTKLTEMTITNIVSEYIEHGIVEQAVWLWQLVALQAQQQYSQKVKKSP